MASIERDDIESALSKKGYQLEPGGDHRYYRLYVGGKKMHLLTKVSMGKKYKTLGEQLVSQMAHQMALSATQLHEFVECSMSGDDYLEALRARGILPPEEKTAEQKAAEKKAAERKAAEKKAAEAAAKGGAGPEPDTASSSSGHDEPPTGEA